MAVFNELETSGIRASISATISESSNPGTSGSKTSTSRSEDLTPPQPVTDVDSMNQPKSSSGPSRPKQAKLTSFNIRPASATRTKQLNQKVLEMIIKDLQPFSIVEDPGFKSLVAALDPTYQLPSRTTLSRALLPQRYADILKEKKMSNRKIKISNSDHGHLD